MCTDNQAEGGREIPSLFPATIKFYNRRTGIFIHVAARRRFFSSREPHRVFHPGEKGFGDRYAAETAAERVYSIFRRLKGRKGREKEREKGRKEGLSSRARTILRGGEFVGRPLARVPAKIIHRDRGTIGERAANKLAVA